MDTATTPPVHKDSTKPRRIRVQVTLNESLYAEASEYARDHGMFPGGVIDVSLERFLDTKKNTTGETI